MLKGVFLLLKQWFELVCSYKLTIVTKLIELSMNIVKICGLKYSEIKTYIFAFAAINLIYYMQNQVVFFLTMQNQVAICTKDLGRILSQPF